MSKIIYFEQHRPVLLTRVTDADLFLDAYVDSDGQKYIAMLCISWQRRQNRTTAS